MDLINAAAYLVVISSVITNTVATEFTDDYQRNTCEGPDGKRYSINSTMFAGLYRLQCQASAEGSDKPASFRRLNCADPHGNIFSHGSVWEFNGLTWKCQMTAGGELRSELTGCVKGVKFDIRTIFECVVADNGEWRLKDSGCIDEENKILHKVGETWFTNAPGYNWRIRHNCQMFGDSAQDISEFEYHEHDKPVLPINWRSTGNFDADVVNAMLNY